MRRVSHHRRSILPARRSAPFFLVYTPAVKNKSRAEGGNGYQSELSWVLQQLGTRGIRNSFSCTVPRVLDKSSLRHPWSQTIRIQLQIWPALVALETKTPFGTEEKYRKYGGFEFQRQGKVYAWALERSETWFEEKEENQNCTQNNLEYLQTN